jgi:hypothetical protein
LSEKPKIEIPITSNIAPWVVGANLSNKENSPFFNYLRPELEVSSHSHIHYEHKSKLDLVQRPNQVHQNNMALLYTIFDLSAG